MPIYNRSKSIIDQVNKQTNDLEQIKSPQTITGSQLKIYQNYLSTETIDISNGGSCLIKCTASFSQPTNAMIELSALPNITTAPSEYLYKTYTYLDHETIDSTAERSIYIYYKFYGTETFKLNFNFAYVCGIECNLNYERVS